MDITAPIILKLLTPFQKIIFAFGGWIAGLFLLIIKPEQLAGRVLIFRGCASIISIPSAMIIDSRLDLDKWYICGVAIAFSYFGWLVLDIAEKKIPKVLNKKADKFIE